MLIDRVLDSEKTVKIIDIVSSLKDYSWVFQKSFSFTKNEEKEFTYYVNNEVLSWHEAILKVKGVDFKKINLPPLSQYLLPILVDMNYEGMFGTEIIKSGFDYAFVTSTNVSKGMRLVNLLRSDDDHFRLYGVNVKYPLLRDGASEEEITSSSISQNILISGLVTLLK
ncbi:MAG: hypothetical protein KKA62_02760 [Nanoarchaeota archaeon]|nr:hypothetical protein [Nanoarchaeota archaeon]MBU1644559.1 hypothetical protein [Nanoarchaeota archaeon]MBU1976852.1 hypothetical protein [Nanoarchaeota archaeon]